METSEEIRQARKRLFSSFLEQDHGHGLYAEKVRTMVESQKTRLLVDLADFRAFDGDTAKRLMKNPIEYMPAFEDALDEYIRQEHPKFLTPKMNVAVGFTGSFGFHRVSPRELLSGYLATLVQVDGIVTKTTLVRPKVSRSVHYCEKTGEVITREYRDVTSNTGPPTGASYPTRDDKGNPLTTEYGHCKYVDHQVVVIQETPENAPAGQLPRSVDVILEGDLVDSCKPGDRVAISGIYKAVPSKAGAPTTGVFRTVVVGNHVAAKTMDIADMPLSPVDIRRVNELRHMHHAERFTVLANSIAPSIYGHSVVKKAILLMLLGGCEKNLQNGTHLRGDINLLLVGDPGVAKSQMLRATMKVAPLSVSTTGRGSSGVGLTAAVTTDQTTGERRLEAGAMVLADRGVVCIDEFDKMGDIDRVTIHEAMEQQTVTIAKAGIHCSLNARCSVFAAANPIYGTYDHSMSIARNIALPDSLLSRFDLVFVLLDKMSAKQDRGVARHVLQVHRYRHPSDDGMTPLDPLTGVPLGTRARLDNGPVTAGEGAALADAAIVGEDEEDERANATNGMYLKFSEVAATAQGHRGTQMDEDEDEDDEEDDEDPLADDEAVFENAAAARAAARRHGEPSPLLTTHMVRKYLQYARIRYPSPTMTTEAGNTIAARYTEMRASSDEKVLPVTARTLETMIRLSTAHARLRLSQNVEQVDVSRALAVLEYAIFARERHNAAKQMKRLKRKRGASGPAEEEEEAEENGDGAGAAAAAPDVAAADAAAGAAPGAPPVTQDEVADSELAEDVEFQSTVRRVLLNLFESAEEDAVSLAEVAEAMPGACADESVPYRVGALVSVLNTMHDEEKVFVDPYPLVASAEELSGTVRMV
ncbi:DNA replication licensing factor MCM3 [Pycnococcus provasolii]